MVASKNAFLALLVVALLVASSSAHVLTAESTCEAFNAMNTEQFKAFKALHPEMVNEAIHVCSSSSLLGEGLSVDFRAEDNLNQHKTADYRSQIDEKLRLVLRRGQSFTIAVSSAPSDLKCTLGGNALDAQVNNDQVTLALPVTSPVGRYEFSCNGVSLGNIAVLFNAWAPEDDVFLDNEEARQEYVLGQVGRMWLGDVYTDGLDGASSRSWTYDQFEVHSIILDLIDMIPAEIRADVRLVSRALTWMINSVHNPKAVLAGNWRGDYTGGVSPSYWTGSGEIYKKWSQQGHTPAKFGQCWVFGGTLTTALRSMGVASRPLTNFRSAHDSPPFDGVIDQSSHESIWNFHVWVDAWMKREDTYGWNAVDATPQEESEGKMQMGPAFLPLIHEKKDGQYDNKFVISEVAAAVWLGKGPYNPKDSNPADFDYEDVGRFISTKKIGCVTKDDVHECREDITAEYKKTGSSSSLRLGLLHPSVIGANNEELHQFETAVLPARPILGEDFRIVVRPSINLAINKAVKLNVKVNVSMITYSGNYIGDVRVISKSSVLSPEDITDAVGNVATVKISVQDYVYFLKNASAIRINVEVEGHGEVDYVYQGQFQLLPQRLSVAPSVATPTIGVPFSAALRFTNPLNVPLTNVVLHANLPEGPRHIEVSDIPAFGQFRYTVEDIVIPSKGHFVAAFALDTTELKYIFGSEEYQLA